MTINRNFPQKVLFFLNLNLAKEIITIGPHLPEYFIDFCSLVEEVSDPQNKTDELTKAEDSIEYLNAFSMSIFGILNAEATRVDTFQSVSKSFPKLLLPFPSDDVESIDKEAIFCLNRFIKYPRFESKPQFRIVLWDNVLKYIFERICAGYLPELNMKYVNKRYGGLFFDGCVAYLKRECVDGLREKHTYTPVLFVEIDQNQLDPGSDHNSLVKSAVSMGAALKGLLGVCRYESLNLLENLCVYGILVGGTKFDVCVIYPDFGTAQESDFGPGKPFPPYHMVFRHSRQFWRFDLFGDERLNDEDSGISEYYFQTRSSKDVEPMIVKAKSNQSRQPSKRIYQTEMNKIIQWDTEIKYISRMLDTPTKINYQSLNILTSIANSMRRQGIAIQNVIDSYGERGVKNIQSEDEKFLYDTKITMLMPS